MFPKGISHWFYYDNKCTNQDLVRWNKIVSLNRCSVVGSSILKCREHRKYQYGLLEKPQQHSLAGMRSKTKPLSVVDRVPSARNIIGQAKEFNLFRKHSKRDALREGLSFNLQSYAMPFCQFYMMPARKHVNGKSSSSITYLLCPRFRLLTLRQTVLFSMQVTG